MAMKKYFTKYLPIGEKVVEGDMAFKEDGTLVYINKAAAKHLSSNWNKAILYMCEYAEDGLYDIVGRVAPSQLLDEREEFDRNDFELRWTNSKGENSLSIRDVYDYENVPTLMAYIK